MDCVRVEKDVGLWLRIGRYSGDAVVVAAASKNSVGVGGSAVGRGKAGVHGHDVAWSANPGMVGVVAVGDGPAMVVTVEVVRCGAAVGQVEGHRGVGTGGDG